MTMQTLIRCPNCGSSNVQYDSVKRDIVCKNCGSRFKEGDLK